MNNNWFWPQYLIIFLWLLSLLLSAHMHGKKHTYVVNFWGKLISLIILGFIMFKGGFFI